MIQKIRYKVLTDGCDPVVTTKGNAVDLVAAKDLTLRGPKIAEDAVKFSTSIIPLGIVMELPKGMKADVKPRSSTFKKWHILQTNTPGLIDSSYCGDIPDKDGKVDEWGMPVIAMSTSHIKKGDRVCQFEIVPTMQASFWQKLKWVLTTKYEFVRVDALNNLTRGGFGSSGKNVEDVK